MTVITADEVRRTLGERLTAPGAAWLDEALRCTADRHEAIGELFPAAGRNCGRGVLIPESAKASNHPLRGWTVDDGVRALLLTKLSPGHSERTAEIEALYRHGDAAEKRGVLRGLSVLAKAEELVDSALALIADALRSNDTRLIVAAMGPFAADNLDSHSFRHGVLKCVFLGIPPADIHGVEQRADAELVRMLEDHARERTAAGREVPAAVRRLVNHHEPNSPREA